MLVATAISIWVFVVAIVLYISAQNAWAEISTALEIQRKANIGMETLLRGKSTGLDSIPRGLCEAKSFIVDNPQKVRFTSNNDSEEFKRSFYLNNNCLMYSDPWNGEIKITDVISNLTFTDSTDYSQVPPKRTVSINLTASQEVRGVSKTIILSGRALLRNG